MKDKLKAKSFMWTKDGITKVVDLWESSTKEQIIQAVGCSVGQLGYILTRLRKSGYPLVKKYTAGRTNSLILEIMKERKIK